MRPDTSKSPATASASTPEQIMRRAEAMGMSPERVARALGYSPKPPAEAQHTMDLERPPLRTRLFGPRTSRRI